MPRSDNCSETSICSVLADGPSFWLLSGLPWPLYRTGMVERSWPVAGPLQLRRSLRFILPETSATARLREDRCVYALHAADGAATVELEVCPDALRASAIGPGARAALEAVPRTVGLDDEPDRFPAGPGLLRDLHLRNPGFRLGSTGRVFDVLLPTILGQRVTTDEAKKSYRHIVSAFGEPAPGNEGLLLPPLPGALAQMSYEDLHRFGVERSRARIIIEVARRAARLEEIVTMEQADAERRLAAVRGIGPWTIAAVMGSAWGDRDAVPRGDFHIPHMVSWLLAGEPRGTDDRMEELLEPYRPYRRRAVILLKMSGMRAPRYGPRSPKSVISQS